VFLGTYKNVSVVFEDSIEEAVVAFFADGLYLGNRMEYDMPFSMALGSVP
jgi:hypothetical protein